jgi:hypothetical protein
MWDQLCSEGLVTKITYVDCHLGFEIQLSRFSDDSKAWMPKRKADANVRKSVVWGFSLDLGVEDLAYSDIIFRFEQHRGRIGGEESQPKVPDAAQTHPISRRRVRA